MKTTILLSCSFAVLRSAALDPDCNHVVFGLDDFFPIGGCQIQRNQIGVNSFEYRAFDFTCNSDGTLTKNTYNSDIYCRGTPISTEPANNDVIRYQCNKGQCDFAELCNSVGCVDLAENGAPDCSKCPSMRTLAKQTIGSQRRVDIECKPIIVDQCFGDDEGITQRTTCSPNTQRESQSDRLVTEIFFGSCDSGARIFRDKYGRGEAGCIEEGYITASCTEESFVSLGYSGTGPVGQVAAQQVHGEEIGIALNSGHQMVYWGMTTWDLALMISNVVLFTLLVFCVYFVVRRKNGRKYEKVVIMDSECDEEQRLQ